MNLVAHLSLREATGAITIHLHFLFGWRAAVPKGGTVYGQTDEYGYKVVENKANIHDLHATILHLLGVDHKRLTFHFSGRDMRLTDVHGEVIRDILA